PVCARKSGAESKRAIADAAARPTSCGTTPRCTLAGCHGGRLHHSSSLYISRRPQRTRFQLSFTFLDGGFRPVETGRHLSAVGFISALGEWGTEIYLFPSRVLATWRRVVSATAVEFCFCGVRLASAGGVRHFDVF